MRDLPNGRPMHTGYAAAWSRMLCPSIYLESDMSNVKEKMTEVIQSQPEDVTYEEIMRELAFERMVERGLDDVRNGRVISSEDMERQIRTWQK